MPRSVGIFFLFCLFWRKHSLCFFNECPFCFIKKEFHEALAFRKYYVLRIYNYYYLLVFLQASSRVWRSFSSSNVVSVTTSFTPTSQPVSSSLCPGLGRVTHSKRYFYDASKKIEKTCFCIIEVTSNGQIKIIDFPRGQIL